MNCAALNQGTAGGNNPADCNWPMCGCDDHANKVIEALQESGLLKEVSAEPALTIDAAEKLLKYSGFLVIAREHIKTIGAAFHVDSHMALRHKEHVVSSMKQDACRALAEKLFREVKFTEMPVEGSEYGPLVSEYRVTLNIFDKSVSDPFLEMLRDEQP